MSDGVPRCRSSAAPRCWPEGAEPCRKLAEPAQRGGCGHPEAWAQSIRDVSAFFESYLKQAGN